LHNISKAKPARAALRASAGHSGTAERRGAAGRQRAQRASASQGPAERT